MNVSLSIDSFPLDEDTTRDMHELLEGLPTNYETVLNAPAWRMPEARGFAVLAYMEGSGLIGFATCVDIVGLHHYEWSAIVHPDFRRQTIGTALADGISYGLQQREAESELAVFIEDEEAAAFLASLGYVADFKEILLGASALEAGGLPEGVSVLPYNDEQSELAAVLVAAFDEEVLSVMVHNIEDAGREIWLMKKDGRIVATATLIAEGNELWITAFAVDPKEQGKGYGQAFLRWCRNHAFFKEKGQVLLDVETTNDAVRVYEKAGFLPIDTVHYWKRKEMK
ncbi:GNAT family N-acetyltransferase [Planomicrobium sp. CPCC 101079]|uniref:GNAT family N-acetyltransferase n=1 Tax=Planomicrobium sp. CPCC 101079 TaxID=2599618 RepID=UPI0011B7661D|nr:GNAT family N-acetyltransferase [Planomicrobium sp. CPCC 101079]TWT03436.1 GNAT family N-acetyltransferase [Planomicrobium sp. CPCC 101079]